MENEMENSALQEAYQSLLEGDRDSILTHLQSVSNDDDVIWLKANGVIDELERLQILTNLSHSNSHYSDLARKIVTRENKYIEQLAEPAEYKFWKKATIKEKFEQLKKKNLWFVWLGLVMVVITVVVTIGVFINDREQKQKEALAYIDTLQTQANVITPTLHFTPSVTPFPYSKRPVGTFSAGQLSILRVENPTTRPVIFGSYYLSEDLEYAEPAKGSEFIAVELEFICHLTICNTPPEAELRLRLTTGGEVGYGSSDKPYLVEFPSTQRVAQKQISNFWVVFEVPKMSNPEAILVYTGYGDQPPELEIEFP